MLWGFVITAIGDSMLSDVIEVNLKKDRRLMKLSSYQTW